MPRCHSPCREGRHGAARHCSTAPCSTPCPPLAQSRCLLPSLPVPLGRHEAPPTLHEVVTPASTAICSRACLPSLTPPQRPAWATEHNARHPLSGPLRCSVASTTVIGGKVKPSRQLRSQCYNIRRRRLALHAGRMPSNSLPLGTCYRLLTTPDACASCDVRLSATPRPRQVRRPRCLDRRRQR